MPPERRDLLLASALTAALVGQLILDGGPAGSGAASATVLLLALRRRRALETALVVVAAFLADAAAGGVVMSDLAFALPVLAFACFSLGRHADGDLLAAAGTAVITAVAVAANQLALAGEYTVLDDAVFYSLILGSPAVLGRLLHHRAGLQDELAASTEVLARTRAEQAAAAVAEERSRLALGLNDVLAHRVGEISMQASGAARVAPDSPQKALDALARIEQVARAVLDDIRDLVGVLRRTGEAVDAPVPSGTPLPAPRQRCVAESSQFWSWLATPRADFVLAGAVFVALAVETLTYPDREGPWWANLLGTAAIAAPLVFRRSRALLSIAAVFALAGLQAVFLTSIGLLVTGIVLGIVPPYSVAAHLPLRGALLGLAVYAAGTLALEPGPHTAVLGLAAFTAGRVMRDRAAKIRRLRAIHTELVLAAGADVARARAEERLRVARELHDAVAHNMTVIVLQAGAARRVWGENAAAAKVAVEALGDVARQTLTELRDTLHAVEPAAPEAMSLRAVVERVRSLGLHVAVEGDEHAAALPQEVERTLVAIVREALTNAVRHAGATRVRLAVRREGEELVVRVADEGAPRGGGPLIGDVGSGSGLRGLAERVENLGGTMRHGPFENGYLVEARLPVREAVPV